MENSFFLNIFAPWLVESMDAEPVDWRAVCIRHIFGIRNLLSKEIRRIFYFLHWLVTNLSFFL